MRLLFLFAVVSLAFQSHSFNARRVTYNVYDEIFGKWVTTKNEFVTNYNVTLTNDKVSILNDDGQFRYIFKKLLSRNEKSTEFSATTFPAISAKVIINKSNGKIYSIYIEHVKEKTSFVIFRFP